MTEFAHTLDRLETQVQARIAEAARTLRSMPLDGPAGYRSAWPDTLRERIDVVANALEMGGRHEDMRPPRAVPSAAAIDRMDDVLGWLLELTPEERELIFGAVAIREASVFR